MNYESNYESHGRSGRTVAAGWQPAAKRCIDVVAAMVGLILATPVLLTVAIAVRLRMGAPVLFWQWRPGRGALPFRMVKFRTMLDASCADGAPLADAARLTPLGTFLRRTSLDELPSLWNVVRGEMSIVGPRPLLMRYLPYFTEEERIRFSMRPGITGLAQINGRNETAWSRRLAYDVDYVLAWSLYRDAAIITGTVQAVLTRRGVVADANAVMRDLDVERRATVALMKS